MEYIDKYLKCKGGFKYYDLLNNNEKQIYDLLLNAFLLYKLKVSFNNVNDQKVQEIIHYVLYDHPYIFYISPEFLITCYKNSVTFEFELMYSIKKIKSLNKIIDKKIRKIEKIVRKNAKSKYQEILLINSMICKEITIYNQMTYNFEDGQIVGVLINNKARCEGVSKFASLILRILNHQMSMIYGYAWEENKRLVKHGWNLLFIDNKYYHMDFSYNLSYSSSSFVCKSFLFLTDNEIFKNHKYEKNIGYPKCNDESLNYFRINNQVVANSMDYSKIKKSNYGKYVLIEYKYAYSISERQLEQSLQSIIVDELKVTNWVDVVYKQVEVLNDLYLLITLR